MAATQALTGAASQAQAHGGARTPQARESAPKTAPHLIPVPRGGALLSGGKPGNRGGTKPPDKVRAASLLAFEQRIPTLARLADDEGLEPGARIKAIDVLGKYGFGAGQVSADQVRERVRLMVRILLRHFGADALAPVLEELRSVWAA